MKTSFISFVVGFVALLAIDGVWLSTMSRSFYLPRIGHLMATTVSFAPVLVFYALYASAISIFIVFPSIHSSYGVVKIFLLGALLGSAAYAAYDLTNQATLKNWPLIVTVVDMFWGAILTGIVAVITTYVTKLFV